MGALACQAIRDADGLELRAEIDVDDDLSALESVQVAVDLTTPAAVMDTVGWCVEHGVHLVVGTSGFTAERLAVVERRLAEHPGVGVLVVPNFSLGAVLMMRFAALAAPLFESVEVVELHHPDKVDAPSGTALRTAQAIASARAAAASPPVPDATQDDPGGARGDVVDGVPVHSVRLRGLTASQEVLLGNPGETLTIRHDMPGREAAMPGLLAAVRAVATMPGLTVGLDAVLGLG